MYRIVQVHISHRCMQPLWMCNVQLLAGLSHTVNNTSAIRRYKHYSNIGGHREINSHWAGIHSTCIWQYTFCTLSAFAHS